MCNADERCDQKRPAGCPMGLFEDDLLDSYGWPDMRKIALSSVPPHDVVLVEVGISGPVRDREPVTVQTDESPPKTMVRVSYVGFPTEVKVYAAVALPYHDRDNVARFVRRRRLTVLMALNGPRCVLKPEARPPEER